MANVRRIQSLSKAAAVLRAMIDVDGSIRLADLASRTGTNRSSLHIMLATLADEDLVEQVGPGEYRLGLGAFEIGAAALTQSGLSSRIAPPMEALASQTGEAVSLSVFHDRSALLVYRFESTQVLRATIRVGTRMPLTTSASGRCLLAFMTDEQRSAAIPDSESTSLSPRDLHRKLDRVRARGYDTQQDEWAIGVSSTAAPVVAARARKTLALSISAPTTRYSKTAWLAELASTARELEQSLAALPPYALNSLV